MSKPIVYVSGPMSGHENYNFPAFNKAADALRKLEYPVQNPADFGAPPNLTWEQCLSRDLGVLVHCEVVVQLPGSRKSKGARLEALVASELGKPVITLANFLAALPANVDEVKSAIEKARAARKDGEEE